MSVTASDDLVETAITVRRGAPVSLLMGRIVDAFWARPDAYVSVTEIVTAIAAAQPSQSLAVCRADVSRSLRRAWQRGLLELHDGRGRTMTGLQQQAREIAARAAADPETFYRGAVAFGRVVLGKPDRWGSPAACVLAKAADADRVPRMRVECCSLTAAGSSFLRGRLTPTAPRTFLAEPSAVGHTEQGSIAP